MSTAQAPPNQASPSGERQIKIVSHSTLFYWWPVWAVGFLMAGLTFVDGSRMAVVPPGTKAVRNADVTVGQQTVHGVDVLVAPEGKHLPPAGSDLPPDQPYLHIAVNKGYGVLYGVILILVIVITNVPLRGMWSVVVLVIVLLGSIILALADWWDPILRALGALHVHINFAGYLIISLALFIVWLVTFMFFDSQIYMVFTPRQLKVCQEIGGQETAYDTTGMSIQKQRSDLFRHWILGLGSGDLIVNTSGANTHHFDFPNVLFVGYKVRMIEEMLREVPVVRG